MTNEEFQRSMDALDKIGQDMENSPEKALDFLVHAGILTPSGELTEPYKQNA